MNNIITTVEEWEKVIKKLSYKDLKELGELIDIVINRNKQEAHKSKKI